MRRGGNCADICGQVIGRRTKAVQDIITESAEKKTEKRIDFLTYVGKIWSHKHQTQGHLEVFIFQAMESFGML